MKCIVDNSAYFIIRTNQRFFYTIKEEKGKWLLMQNMPVDSNNHSYYMIKVFEFDTEQELANHATLLWLETA